MGVFPSHANGKARVDTRNPSAYAICDRCGIRHNRSDLRWQMEWAGSQLQNLRLLVCQTCYDIPNEQQRVYVPPPDPVPVRDPRPETLSAPLDLIVVTTIACAPTYYLVDGNGNLILDGNGNPILEVQGQYGTLLGADASRQSVWLMSPWSYGLWLNPLGGLCQPGAANTTFYAPDEVFSLSGAAAQSAVTYFSQYAGAEVVVSVS